MRKSAKSAGNYNNLGLADNHKAVVQLGFQPKTGLEEGIENTVNWYLSQL